MKDCPRLGANEELGKHTIYPTVGSSAHRYLARQLSTKDARQFTEGATHDGRFVGEVSEIKSETVTRHNIYIGSGHQLDVIP